MTRGRATCGEFKCRKADAKGKNVLVEEQDGSLCPNERETQEHHLQGASVVKHVVHVENEPLVDRDLEA